MASNAVYSSVVLILKMMHGFTSRSCFVSWSYAGSFAVGMAGSAVGGETRIGC